MAEFNAISKGLASQLAVSLAAAKVEAGNLCAINGSGYAQHAAHLPQDGAGNALGLLGAGQRGLAEAAGGLTAAARTGAALPAPNLGKALGSLGGLFRELLPE